jgi:hypothetical protein
MIDQQTRCNAWNLANPIGVPVMVKCLNGATILTRTRTEAHMFGGAPIICVNGIPGHCLLAQVRPLHELTLEYR